MQRLRYCVECANLARWHIYSGNLAAAAASHWKRSLAIVLAVLVTLGVLAGVAGGSFTDDFSSPGTESQKAIDLLEQRFPAQSGDTATVVFSVERGDAPRRWAPAGDRCRARRDPRPAARDGGRRSARRARARSRATVASRSRPSSTTSRLWTSASGPASAWRRAAEGRAGRHRGLAQGPGRGSMPSSRPRRGRADRHRGRGDRPDAGLPLRGSDAAHAVRVAAVAGRRHDAAHDRLGVRRLPELRSDPGRDARPRRRDRLRAADRRALPRAARRPATPWTTPRGWRTRRPGPRSSRRAPSSSWRSRACSRPACRSSGAWDSARRSWSRRSPSAPSRSCRC